MSIPVGQYVIVRTHDAGVHAGHYVSHSGREVVVANSRRLWYWSSQFTLSELALTGVPSSRVGTVKFSVENPQEVHLLEACEIIPCSEVGVNSIRAIIPYTNNVD